MMTHGRLRQNARSAGKSLAVPAEDPIVTTRRAASVKTGGSFYLRLLGKYRRGFGFSALDV